MDENPDMHKKNHPDSDVKKREIEFVLRSLQEIDRLLEKLGIEKEFSRKDKLTYGCCMALPLIFIGVFVIGTIYNVFINREVSDQSWLRFWHVWIIVIISAFFTVTVWQTIGGLKDFREMFKRLRTIVRDDSDDGTVVHRHNLNNEEEAK